MLALSQSPNRGRPYTLSARGYRTNMGCPGRDIIARQQAIGRTLDLAQLATTWPGRHSRALRQPLGGDQVWAARPATDAEPL